MSYQSSPDTLHHTEKVIAPSAGWGALVGSLSAMPIGIADKDPTRAPHPAEGAMTFSVWCRVSGELWYDMVKLIFDGLERQRTSGPLP